MHVCGIYYNGTDEPIYRSGIEMQMQRTDLWTRGVYRGDGMNWEIGIDDYALLCVKQRVGTCYILQGAQLNAL